MSYDQTSKQIFIYTLRLGNSADLEYMISIFTVKFLKELKCAEYSRENNLIRHGLHNIPKTA